MNDKEINAALAEVGAGWLMDSSDEHCQSAAMRHLVAAVKAAERERCAALCESKRKVWDGSYVDRFETPGQCASAILGTSVCSDPSLP